MSWVYHILKKSTINEKLVLNKRNSRSIYCMHWLSIERRGSGLCGARKPIIGLGGGGSFAEGSLIVMRLYVHQNLFKAYIGTDFADLNWLFLMSDIS